MYTGGGEWDTITKINSDTKYTEGRIHLGGIPSLQSFQAVGALRGVYREGGTISTINSESYTLRVINRSVLL